MHQRSQSRPKVCKVAPGILKERGKGAAGELFWRGAISGVFDDDARVSDSKVPTVGRRLPNNGEKVQREAAFGVRPGQPDEHRLGPKCGPSHPKVKKVDQIM